MLNKLAKLFSQRIKPESLPDVSQEVRMKIWLMLSDLNTDMHVEFGRSPSGELLSFTQDYLIRVYGGKLYTNKYKIFSSNEPPIVQHFFSCPTAQLLDFLEVIFHSFRWRDNPLEFTGERQQFVERINELLRENDLPFELSPYVERLVENPNNKYAIAPGTGERIRLGECRDYIEVTYPQIILKKNELVFAIATEPCLTALSGKYWKSANEEILDAHAHFRKGEHADCILDCCKAFETTLKTICKNKKWAYSETDTVSLLLGICKDNGLFYTFYTSILTAIGTVRNKLGGHGKGPDPQFIADEPMASHMLGITLSGILMLVRQANL